MDQRTTSGWAAILSAALAASCGDRFDDDRSSSNSSGSGSGGSGTSAASSAVAGPGGGGSTPAASCGDGRLDPASEECDDGNTAAGDGCDALCGYEIEVLLIPHTLIGDKRLAMFDGFDGHYLGDFVDPALANALMSFPFNAVQGPDAKIYLADSGNESVHRFTQHGLDDGVFADMSDVLGDAHGIAFFESMVYVASGGSAKVIAVFDENGERQPDYLSSGINPYDLFFFDDGRMALSDIDGDAVKLYAPGGGSHVTLTATGFPEQLAYVDGDTMLVAEFIGDEVFELSTSGQRGRSADADNPRGVAPLENGHWLVTSGDGVLVIDPDAGTIVDVHFGGDGGWRFIEPAWLPADLF